LIRNKSAELLIYASLRVDVFSLKLLFRYFTGFVCVFLKIHIIPRVIIHSFHQTSWISRMTGESILVVSDALSFRVS